ncbi:MAG: Isoleucine-tRNA ligase, partial [candidate division WWE3 bacterium GW2011_GWA1_46_21]
SPAVLDVWILARLQETINAMCENLDKYLIMNAAKALAPFAADLSTWYIRRSRERLKLGDLAALGVLYYSFVIFSKLMAPILPFLSETFYSLLNVNQLSGLDSVHLDLYPERIKLTAAQEEVLKVMTNTRRVVSLALSVRDTAGIGVRQPLETLFVLSKKEQIRIYDELVKADVNVKNVVMASDAKELPGGLASAKDGDVFVHLDLTLSQELKEAGAVRELVRKIQDMRKRNGLGVGAVRELVRKIQDMRKRNGLGVTQKVSVVVDGKDVPEKLLLTFGDVLKQKVLATKIIRGDKYELTPQD